MIILKSHDGPARIAKYDETITPAILDYKTIDVIDNIKTPFKLQKEIVEENMKKTLEMAHDEEDKTKIAVIHGSQYTDLRIECAKKLEKEGYTTMMFANADHLQKNPKDLLDIIINVRENINPTTALYMPFVPTQNMAILTYIGIDLFDNTRAIYEARNNNLMTTDNIYPYENYKITDNLEEENLKQLDFMIKEIQENIKNKTLRNLCEQKATTNPETMTMFRLLDKNYPEYLEKYTPLY